MRKREEYRREDMTEEGRAGLRLVWYASNDMHKTWNLSMYLQPEVDVSMLRNVLLLSFSLYPLLTPAHISGPASRGMLEYLQYTVVGCNDSSLLLSSALLTLGGCASKCMQLHID